MKTVKGIGERHTPVKTLNSILPMKNKITLPHNNHEEKIRKEKEVSIYTSTIDRMYKSLTIHM